MPYTVNGIGTWYWGKRNVQRRMGTCGFCSRSGELKSYDTTLYVVLVYLPIIPLGKKRIVDECPVCRRHRAAKLKDFLAAKQKDISEVISAMRAAPNDPEKVVSALQILAAYQEKEKCEALAAGLSEHFKSNSKVQWALAEACAFFGNYEAALPAYRQALALDNNDENRESLARCLLALGRPDEAAPCLGHIGERKETSKRPLLYLLVEGYQSRAEHEKALAVLDGIADRWPGSDKEKLHRKLLAISRRHRKTGRAIKSANFATSRPAKSSGGDFGGRLAKVLIPTVIVLAVAVYLYACYEAGRSYDVNLVNGTTVPYTIDINGEEYLLAPMDVRFTKLAGGPWNVSVIGTAMADEETQISYSSPFFIRPFVDDTLVINPDRVAVFTETTVAYSVNPDPNEDVPFSVHSGKGFYAFGSIDYPFVGLPDEVELPSEYATVKKSNLMLYEPVSALDAFQVVEAHLGPSGCKEYVKRRLFFEPGEQAWVFSFSALAPPEEVVETLRPALKDRPLRVEWHRGYQGAMEAMDPDYDLAGDYLAMAEAEPENPCLKYLAGRVMPGREEADRWFLAAEQCGKPIGYGYNALAFNALCDGDFGRGLRFSEQALDVVPGSSQFHYNHTLLLEAAGRYAELLRTARSDRKASPDDLGLLLLEVKWLGALGRDDEAEKVAKQYLDALPADVGPAERAIVSRAVSSLLANLQGRYDEYAKLVEQWPGADGAFTAAMTRGDLEKAAACLPETQPDVENQLLLYAAAAGAGAAEISESCLAAAIDMLASGDASERKAAALLKATELDVDAMLNLEVFPGRMRHLLLAAGMKFPAHRSKLFEKARRMNFEKGYPRHVIQRMLEQ